MESEKNKSRAPGAESRGSRAEGSGGQRASHAHVIISFVANGGARLSRSLLTGRFSSLANWPTGRLATAAAAQKWTWRDRPLSLPGRSAAAPEKGN